MKITLAFLATAFLAMTGTTPAKPTWLASRPQVIEFQTGDKIFRQTEQDTKAENYDYFEIYGAGIDAHRRFSEKDFEDGMYHKPAWVRFHDSIVHYNSLRLQKLPAEEFKILVFQRHGQGWHNVAEKKYGTPAWNCYWAQQEGDGNMTWSDPVLSPQGEDECKRLNIWYRKWFGNPDDRKEYLKTLGLPMFESYYVSPLTRTMQTANMAFEGIDFPADRPYRPIVKELLREDISTHTCDRRSTKSEIAAKFPNVVFEDGFSEEDELWDAEEGETEEEGVARARAVLEDIFQTDKNTWISITTHSGMLRNMLKVLGHRPFPVKTGQILPVYARAKLIREPTEEQKAEAEERQRKKMEQEDKKRSRKQEQQRKNEDEAWEKMTKKVLKTSGTPPSRSSTTGYEDVQAEKTCASLPVVTSIEGRGCICSESPAAVQLAPQPSSPSS